MGWVKLDDNFFGNKKVVQVSRDAKVLYLAGLCYAGASLTDGVIPSGALPILAAQTGIRSPKKYIDELIRVGLWIDEPDGYAIHDYLEHNTSASDVQVKRDQARERMQRHRSRNVRANNERSSRNVREPETEIETDTERTEANASVEDARERATSPAKRATKVPDSFPIDDRWEAWGAEHGFTVAEMRAQVPRFQDHYRAKGQTRKDWAASFRTWMRNARDWGHLDPTPIRPNGRASPPDDFTAWERKHGLRPDDPVPDVIDVTGQQR